jgi:ATP-dependent DNA ligase
MAEAGVPESAMLAIMGHMSRTMLERASRPCPWQETPFDHPDWIFEPKLDGFRAVAYLEDGDCRLVSRNRNAFRTFDPLAQAIGRQFAGHRAIILR